MSSDKLGLLPASLSTAAEPGPTESSMPPGESSPQRAVAPKPRKVLVRKPKVVAIADPASAQLDLPMPEPAALATTEAALPTTDTALAASAPQIPKPAAKPRRLKLASAVAPIASEVAAASVVPVVTATPLPASGKAPRPLKPVAEIATTTLPTAAPAPADASPPTRAQAEVAPAPLPMPEQTELARASPPTEAQAAVAASSHAPVVHRIHAVALGRKRDALQHLLAQQPEQPTLIYPRPKHGADKIARVLERSGIKAAAIHGDKSQGARNRALAGFKSGELKALVITDIAARLLDADNLPLVISYDLPHITEDYTQRIARTGSAQAPGLAITLITQEESPQFRAVRDLLQYPLELAPLDGFEAAEPFDPERDPLPKPGAETEGSEAPKAAAVEPKRDGQGRGRRERRGRQGRPEVRPREATLPVAPEAALAEGDELPGDAQPRGLNPIHEARPLRHERKPRPGRTARGERQPRGDQQPRGDRQPGFDQPLAALHDDDDDAPGYGNSLAAPPPSQLVAGGPGRRRGRRDPFATVVVDENRVNIYDERQPDDYRDQWSVLGPDTNRPSWTYAEHQPQSLDAPPPRRPNPPAARRSGPGAGPRGPQSGPRGPQRQGRPRRSEGR